LGFPLLNQIVHEIKTPITAIRIHSDILKDISTTIEEPPPEDNKKETSKFGQFKKSLSALYRNVNRLNQLFDDIIFVNRPFKKASPSTLKAEEVQKILSEASEIFKQNLIISNTLERDLLIDGSRLRIILNNLITNAIKYGKRAHLSIAVFESHCQFRVKDEGEGISRLEARLIFGQFYRTSQAEKNPTGGLGLGLFIAHKLAKESNTKIWLENPGEKGALFIYEVPLKNTE